MPLSQLLIILTTVLALAFQAAPVQEALHVDCLHFDLHLFTELPRCPLTPSGRSDVHDTFAQGNVILLVEKSHF